MLFRSAYGGSGKVIAVMQPHRYSRLGALRDEFAGCFGDADTVIIADVYAAGEAPIEGVDSGALVAGLKRRGHRNAATVDDAADLAGKVAADLRADDMIVCLGAGDITKWAAGLAAAISGKAKEAA